MDNNKIGKKIASLREQKDFIQELSETNLDTDEIKDFNKFTKSNE